MNDAFQLYHDLFRLGDLHKINDVCINHGHCLEHVLITQFFSKICYKIYLQKDKVIAAFLKEGTRCRYLVAKVMKTIDEGKKQKERDKENIKVIAKL